MEEKQVTIGKRHTVARTIYGAGNPNPLEQQGTYLLPEAQLDRFMLKLKIGYPSKEEELLILETTARTSRKLEIEPVTTPEEILKVRQVVDQVYLDPKIKDYIVKIIHATRKPEEYKLAIGDYIECGASPRATINLAVAAKAYAFMQGRGYVVPNDIKRSARRSRATDHCALRSEADEVDAGDIKTIFDQIEVPDRSKRAVRLHEPSCHQITYRQEKKRNSWMVACLSPRITSSV